MLGVDAMTMLEVNMNLLSTIPESEQIKINAYLKENYCKNPFVPKSAENIYSDLAESRAYYERGEYEDFDDALDDISKRYGL